MRQAPPQPLHHCVRGISRSHQAQFLKCRKSISFRCRAAPFLALAAFAVSSREWPMSAQVSLKNVLWSVLQLRHQRLPGDFVTMSSALPDSKCRWPLSRRAARQVLRAIHAIVVASRVTLTQRCGARQHRAFQPGMYERARSHKRRALRRIFHSPMPLTSAASSTTGPANRVD